MLVWKRTKQKKKGRKKKVSSQRKKRAEIRAENNDPINVTVIEGGLHKVISYEEYEEKYLNVEDKEE